MNISLRKTLFLSIPFAACISLFGCHSSAVQRAVSPLVGSWNINGDTPAADPNLPRFTAFTFHRDGSVDASYVQAGGVLAGLAKTQQKIGNEQDTYTLIGKNKIRIIEGSRALEYTYEVQDEKLFLRSASTDQSSVFARVTSSDETKSGSDTSN